MSRVAWTASGGGFEVTEFKRGLSPKFIDALGVLALAKTNCWWKDVLADPTLLIGIRNEAFDVYWHGQALFCATYTGRVLVTTHVKYLLDPDRSDRVPLNEDRWAALLTEPMIKRYGGRETLEKMKRAADLFAGDEKRGVHAIALANDNIIDVEIQLDARKLGTERKEPRIDIAALKETADGIELVFWEAKLFANKELRAKGDSKPDVVEQIEEYRKVLAHYRPSVISSCICVAKNCRNRCHEQSGQIGRCSDPSRRGSNHADQADVGRSATGGTGDLRLRRRSRKGWKHRRLALHQTEKAAWPRTRAHAWQSQKVEAVKGEVGKDGRTTNPSSHTRGPTLEDGFGRIPRVEARTAYLPTLTLS